jgi:hypothetical protein
MAQTKIHIKVGQIEFLAEGEEAWTTAQTEKFHEKVRDLTAISGEEKVEEKSPGKGPKTEASSKPLATFLRENNANEKQVKKFLATAIWLEDRGAKRVSTAAVSKALKETNQSRLSNAAECLNQNVGKGHCEKDGNEFYVTPEGRASLGGA